jgi:hypothetical protein
MKQRSVFWPLTLIAAGVLWILVSTNVIPASNLWALVHILPYLLMAFGVGLILRSFWRPAGMIVSALIVIGAVAAVVYAPRLGWAQIPPWSFAWEGEPFIGGRVAGSGEVETETRDVKGFSAVSIEYPATVTVRQGAAESLEVEADDNLLPQLTTSVQNGTLLIRNSERDWSKRVNPSQTVKITITVKELNDVDFSSAGTLIVEGLETENLDINLNGAGEVTLENLELRELDCNLSGAGSIHADGTADKVYVQIDGFGSFYGDKLDSMEADIGINGAGSANVRVKDNLIAEINGAGSVGYYGSPEVDQQINGAGTVNQLDE